ncbi:MAG: hypothetical protein EON96_21080, partial [Caulobacteraceae bacterium]
AASEQPQLHRLAHRDPADPDARSAPHDLAADLAIDPANRAAVHGVTRRLLAVAEPYYDSARDGLRGLPFRSSMAIAAARGVYREIGRKVVRRGPGVWVSRVSVGKPMKLWLFGRGALIAVWTQVLDRGKALPPRPDLWTRV